MLIYSDNAFSKHCGPNGSLECPQRLMGLLEADKAEIKDKYWPMVYKVHSKKYIEYLKQRCRDIGRTNWSCTHCSYTNLSSNKRCKMCNSLMLKEKWEYLGMVNGDTTYINRYSFDAIKSAVNCTCNMIDDLINNKLQGAPFSIIRPPGHHAEKDIGKGFCLINNVAIAAEYALSLGLSKIFILDWDLHHGDGIQKHFYNRSDVFYCSLHGDDLYPHTGKNNETGEGDGKGFNMNISLPRNTNNDVYFHIIESLILSTIQKFNPDLILIATGFDGLKSDPLKYFSLTPNIYPKIINRLKKIGKHLALILEGGYDIQNIPLCIKLCLNELQP